LDLDSLSIQNPQAESSQGTSSTQGESMKDGALFTKRESSYRNQIEIPPKK